MGVGPGDPELLTYRAVRCLQESPVLAIPQSGGERELALDIIRPHVDLNEKILLPLSFPMNRNVSQLREVHLEQAQKIRTYLDQGLNVALPNLGDVSIYSTFTYVKKPLEEWGYSVEMIPGIPSFCAVAARLGQTLVDGNQPLHILPSSYLKSKEALHLPGTKVLMKPRKELSGVLQMLTEEGLLEQASMVQNCGLSDEAVYETLIPDTQPEAGYFTTFVIREER